MLLPPRLTLHPTPHPAARRRRPALLTALLALLLLAAPLRSAHAEGSLGRLFFTPERRQHLDQHRQLKLPDPQDAQENPILTINGVVTRSSGKRTVWINGNAQHESGAHDANDNIRAIPERRNPGYLSVRPSDSPDASDTRAAVGDTVNRSTGETSPLLGDGRISVKSAPRPTLPSQR